MSSVYFVGYRTGDMRCEDRDKSLGIFTNRYLAMETARASVPQGGDNIYWIIEYNLNKIDEGHNIWCDECDHNTRGEVARNCYTQYWPIGFPGATGCPYCNTMLWFDSDSEEAGNHYIYCSGCKRSWPAGQSTN